MVAVGSAGGKISGVVVAIGAGSTGGVEVAVGGTRSLAGTIGGVDVATGVPAFCVAPHAPPEVLITPPSIYIHFKERQIYR